jgi:hypothetical protein
MTSDLQIAANRRNAEKSTGPGTKSGKQRTSRNAYRHGLAARPSRSVVAARQVRELAREIAGDRLDMLTLDLTRSAAEAMFDLACVRRAKMHLLERATEKRSRDPRELLSADLDPQRRSTTAVQHQADASRDSDDFVLPRVGAKPPNEGGKICEAMLQNLSELQALDRYERRMSSRRDRAIRQIAKRRQHSYGTMLPSS